MRIHVLAIALVLTLLAAGVTWERTRPAGLMTHGMVSRVVDGDTVYVSSGGRSEDVRLLGIDTPETVDPRRPVGCYGPEASAYTKHLLTGRQVTLVYDRVTRDVYGRYLAYVYLDGDPPVFVDAQLVELGYARTLSIPPNTRHAALFAHLEERAALAGRGLWSACGE
jgi:endonuclease YncB( thermonuclease family)